MLTDRLRSRWFGLATTIAMFAIGVQALIPFVLAGDIAAVDAGAFPICSADRSPGAPADRNHHPDQPHSGGTCPICAALAAAMAVTTPAAIALPVPLGWRKVAMVATGGVGEVRATRTAFKARAPPLNG